MRSRGVVLVLAALGVAVAPVAVCRACGDPDALWRIVSEAACPTRWRTAIPPRARWWTCGAGGAILKDLVGATQFLLIPTERVSGIDDPAILAATSPNYFADAWRARSFVDERAGARLPRQWISLAINSAVARSQDQLHVHVDCVRPDVHDALTDHAAAIGPSWAPFPVLLSGHRYDAMSVGGDDLDANPFTLLADGIPGARADMGDRTLVVVGAVAADGRPGFVILTDRADAATGDQAAGEELQDHDSCPRRAAALPGK